MMRRLFAIRDARVFLLGSGLSMLGDSAMFLVLGIWAKDLTHSNAAAGLVFFVLILPSLFAPFAGLVVDRVRKRPLLIGVNCIMAASVLLLLFVHDRGDLWLIYAVAALYGAAGAILGSARSAFLTVMLPRELLGDANAVFSTTREGLRLLAPLLGAGLYAAFSGRIVAIADGLTFVGLAVALLFVRTPETRIEREEQHFLTELSAGVRHVFATLPLRRIILAGFAVSWFIVGFATSIQLRTPQRLQGRVASAANTMVGTPQTIGIALGAFLVSVLDYRVLVAVMFVAISACSAYLLTRGPEAIAAEEPALA